MISDLELAKEKLSEPGCTFAAAKNGKVISSDKRGILPLIELYEKGDLAGWSCADKVCGKAPACVYIQLRVKEVYSRVMTYTARDLMENAGISCSSDIPAEKIINREGTDICPMEKLAAGFSDPYEAAEALRKRVRN